MIHCDPLSLPEADLDEDDSDDAYPRNSSLDPCPAQRRFRDGCKRYCSRWERWSFIVVLRVCKTFHDAASALPQLWQDVDLRSTQCSRTHLINSKNTRLEVDLERLDSGSGLQIHSSMAAFLHVVSEAMSRIQRLSVTGCADLEIRDNFFGSSFTPQPAGCLEFLCLAYPSSGMLDLGLPHFLKQDQSPPNLRSISLYNVNLVASPHLLTPTLTHVSLGQCPSAWSSISEMANSLVKMQSLKSLSIQENISFPEDMEDEFLAFTGNAQLSRHLKELLLSGSVIVVTNFLDVFDFPPSTALGLDFLHNSEVTHVPTRLIPAIKRHIACEDETCSSPYTRASAHLGYSYGANSFELRLARDFGVQPSQSIPSEILIRHDWPRIDNPDWILGAETIASAIHDVLPFAGVCQLLVSQSGHPPELYDRVLWWHPFRRMEHLQRICLQREPAEFLAWASHDDDASSLPFPNLETLALRNVVFDSSGHWRAMRYEGSQIFESVQQLVICRREAGMRPWGLKLLRCPIPETMLRSLQDLFDSEELIGSSEDDVYNVESTVA